MISKDPNSILQVRKGRSYIYQQDIVDVLDKQLLEGMGVLLTEEEQQKCEQSVCTDILCTIYLKSYYDRAKNALTTEANVILGIVRKEETSGCS